MIFPGAGGQNSPHQTFDAGVALTGSPQLLLPLTISRLFLLIQNVGADVVTLDFGGARASAAISNGGVSAITVTNGGFGFSFPPLVQFLGGGQNQYYQNAPTDNVGYGAPFFPTPGRPAQARCVLTAGAVTSIVIDDPGAGYVAAPYVRIINDPRDPIGAAKPVAGQSMSLAVGASFVMNNTFTTCDQVSVLGTAGQYVACKYL